MQFSSGNRAIRDHVKDGKDLLLLEALGPSAKLKAKQFVFELEASLDG